jgi:hypothetical protein
MYDLVGDVAPHTCQSDCRLMNRCLKIVQWSDMAVRLLLVFLVLHMYGVLY